MNPRADHTARLQTPLSPALRPQAYLSIPYRLADDCRDSPLAIGLYSLVARLFVVAHTAVPLSAPDVQRYDPALKRGAVVRAFNRLVRVGWLTATARDGHKTHYLPTWGPIAGAPRPWQIDAPVLGRPRHVHTVRLDERLLDTFIGRLTPHAIHAARVDRYVKSPLLGLADVGSYVLALLDQPAETPQLLQWGLVRRDQAMPVPPDEVILARASQLMSADTSISQLTSKGLQKFGQLPVLPAAAHSTSAPLFFVPPELIDSLIGPMIGGLIGQPDRTQEQENASESDQNTHRPGSAGIPWNPTDQPSQRISSSPPVEASTSGDGRRLLSKHTVTRKAPAASVRIPCTETASLLRSLNVLPGVIAELADLPVEMARAAIAHGQARSDVRDLAGWVVKLLRTARDHQWQIPCATDASSTTERRLTDLEPSAAPVHESHAYVDEAEQAVETEPSGAEIDTTAEISPRIRMALRARVPRKLWPLIERITADTDADATTITLMCERQSDIPVVQSQILPLVRSIVREFGWSHMPHLAIGAPRPVTITSEESATQQPAWVPATAWAALPAVLRVALSGASLVDGQLRGATPTLTALLHTRFAAEVQALLEDHGSRAADGL